MKITHQALPSVSITPKSMTYRDAVYLKMLYVKSIELWLQFLFYLGMTPLLAASVTGHLHIVEHLIGKLFILGHRMKIAYY